MMPATKNTIIQSSLFRHLYRGNSRCARLKRHVGVTGLTHTRRIHQGRGLLHTPDALGLCFPQQPHLPLRALTFCRYHTATVNLHLRVTRPHLTQKARRGVRSFHAIITPSNTHTAVPALAGTEWAARQDGFTNSTMATLNVVKRGVSQSTGICARLNDPLFIHDSNFLAVPRTTSGGTEHDAMLGEFHLVVE